MIAKKEKTMKKKYDQVFVNGKIYTADREKPYADAFAVKDGRIAWIGKAADISLEGEGKTDLEGKRVLPGFIDSHMHPIMLAETNKQISCLPPLVHSIEEIVEAVAKTRQQQGADSWILGWGYDEGKLAEGRTPTRYDLDRGAADVPVSMVRTCGHVRCVNSKALELAGIDRNTKDPSGGQIDRDENGEPTGVLRENARNLVTPFMPEDTAAIAVQNVIDMNEMLLSQGVTTIADMGELGPVDYYDVYTEAREKGFCPRVSMYYMWDFFRDDKNFDIDPAHMNPDIPVRVAGLKLIGDGSVSGRTAWCDQPYLNGNSHDCGMPVCTPQDIQECIAFCKEHNCQLSVHAMGAKAIERAVHAGYVEGNWLKGDTDAPFMRIEHVAMPTEKSTKEAAEAGIAFVTQPIFLYAEIESYLNNLGPDWTKENYPVTDWMKAGVRMSFSTDAPATAWATPSDPFPCLKGAVTRVAYDGTDCGAKHRVDIETAVWLYTSAGRQMLGFKNIGQLTEGYHADFIVLDQDLLQVPPEQIDQVKVEQTYMDGTLVYQRAEK